MKQKKQSDEEPELVRGARKTNPKLQLFVLTGGQDGVDTGAADAARLSGFPWGMRLPKGYRRESPLPKWAKEFVGERITEVVDCPAYNERTERVISSSTAVLIIQPDGDSTPGTILTIKLAERAGLNYWRFMSISDKAAHKAEAHAVAYWLRSLVHLQRSVTLMVAGPREGKWDGAEEMARNIVTMVLEAFENDRPPVAKEKK